jgi:[NiFe] hydrogenase diaphorase moiety large subunit
VNNVETFCKVTKIIQEGPASFAMYGKGNSTGTKMLSISGDCARPGVYEVPFGVSVQTILDLSGGEDAIGVQVSGPSGRMVEPENFHREISFEDVPTGGSIMIFGPGRNLLDVVHAFMEFFCEESCGFCTPCRVGNVLMKEQLEKLMAGHGSLEDLEYLKNLGKTIKATSRCGLGETSPNPMLTTIENYPELYTNLLKEPDPGLRASFNVRDALTEAEGLAERSSRHFPSKKQEVMQ